MKSTLSLFLLFSVLYLPHSLVAQGLTEVEIRGEQFYINGEPTYEGRTWKGNKIEGLYWFLNR